MRKLSIVVLAFMVLQVSQSMANETQKITSKQQTSKQQAIEQGNKDARRDFARGIYRVESYGLKPRRSVYYDYLNERYHVTEKTVAGCIVTDEIVGHATGYNAVMQQLLNKKYQKDIFQEAKDYAKSYYE